MSGQQVFKNIVWRIGALSPTSVLASERFRHLDNPTRQGEDQSLADRSFQIYFDSSERVETYSDLAHRWNDVTYVMEFGYKAERLQGNFHQLLLDDRNDLLKLLRDPANYSGYSDDNSTDDIGLKNRVFDGDELEREGPTWIYRMRWIHKIEEAE